MSDDWIGVMCAVALVLAVIGFLSVLVANGITPGGYGIPIPFPVLLWWEYIIAIIAVAEVFFFLDNDDKPSKKSKVFQHTIEQKILWLSISLGVVFAVQGIASIIYIIFPFIYENWFNGLQAIGVVAIIIIAVYLYTKINSLKYRNIKYKTKKRGAKK